MLATGAWQERCDAITESTAGPGCLQSSDSAALISRSEMVTEGQAVGYHLRGKSLLRRLGSKRPSDEDRLRCPGCDRIGHHSSKTPTKNGGRVCLCAWKRQSSAGAESPSTCHAIQVVPVTIRVAHRLRRTVSHPTPESAQRR
jgi:hypothetical protein